jgi:hypothetical protein
VSRIGAEAPVAIVGAGPAGIASALALKDRGIRALVLDKADHVASSWRARYSRLRLNTSRPLSHLPGRPFARGTPLFPSRDEFIAHVERHAAEDGIELRLGTAVERIDTDNGNWVLDTTSGQVHARQVIVATGYEHIPFIPEWPGRELFSGLLLHAAEYRNAEPFVGERVLVVGPGCSGMEIAHELAHGGASTVWLSARTPPNIVLRQGPGGLPGDMLGVALLRLPPRLGDRVARFGRRMDLGDLSAYGLPVPEEGIFTRLRRTGQAPAVVDREVIESIKGGAINIVPGVEALDEDAVLISGGVRLQPDAVICATGYRRGLEQLLRHLDVLDERGAPVAVGDQPAAPGLRFIGFVPRPGGLGYMGREATRAANAIARELGFERHSPPPRLPA